MEISGLGAKMLLYLFRGCFWRLHWHLFPVWLKFKGGKGVATYIGILLGVAPYGALIFCAIWWRGIFISLLLALSNCCMPPHPFILEAYGNTRATGLLLICRFVTHHQASPNIKRLLKGEESKISFSK